jgi:hypothetical protein
LLSTHCSGVAPAYLRWESQSEEIALELEHGSTVRVSELSPLGVAVWKKALPVVKYLAERQSTSGAGLKEYLQTGSYTVKGGAVFSTPLLPLLYKTKDIDTLNYLLR